ncbi:MAG: methyltransferase domain-containing protein [Myxacorys chilensis ATA2-1-KO14]|jgi:SAM-dependent methyltransferase|nr:methyltransferase domain-containing protein [Myxacorys chilensis ATA2-1-KO14]
MTIADIVSLPILSHQKLESRCPVCVCLTQITTIANIPAIPVNSLLLYTTRSQALSAQRCAMHLGFCENCGHAFNLKFDSSLMEYSQHYDNSLHFSQRFQQYAETLSHRLIERHQLRHKTVVEIGCGKGDFINLFCQLGNNSGIGFDPSYEPTSNQSETKHQVEFIQDFYSEHYANYDADLIVCRQVLEHILDLTTFLKGLRRTIGQRSDTVLYFEVPNMSFMMQELDIWNIFYEHYSYFTYSSLAYLFANCGFIVHEIGESFGRQFLYIEAKPAEEPRHLSSVPWVDPTQTRDDVAGFAERYRDRIETWRNQFKQIKRSGKKAVVWGAGARGVTFLNTLGNEAHVEYVVDINPRKQGKYVAGTGQQIVSPEFLKDYQPDIVILMNPNYLSEIQAQIADLGLAPDFLCA